MRTGSGRVTLVFTLAALVACGGEEEVFDDLPAGEAPPVPDDHVRSELSAAVSGPWVIPPATLAAGDGQYISYTGAGPWRGSSSCAGGMTPGAARFAEDLEAAFPQIFHVGGYACRPINGNSSVTSVHATGRALDIHIATIGGEADNGEGDPIGNWLIENAERIGVQYIIWDRWTWGGHRPSGAKDRYYGGAHPHHDHLHVELSVQAASLGTDWFRAAVCGDNTCSPDETCSSCASDCGVCGPYDDVPGDHTFAREIEWLRATGITRGCTSDGSRFCPNDEVSRAQMASFLARALSLPASSTDFFDDDAGSVHEAAINRIAAAGITTGCGGRRYCPDEPVTREQMASFLVRAFSLSNTSTDFFTDDTGSVHEANINRIAAAGITRGCGADRYCPNNPVTRAQMAAFLYRSICHGAECEPPFQDVPLDHPFVNAIRWLSEEGITHGCNAEGTSFCPDQPVLREQMASFLSRALSLPATSTDFFTDDDGSVHEANINRIAEASITQGCGATTFCPEDEVTREQMASFLARALSLPATSTDYFTDDDESIHQGAINRLAAAGITSGCGGGHFCPDEALSRAQMAAFLHRALD